MTVWSRFKEKETLQRTKTSISNWSKLSYVNLIAFSTGNFYECICQRFIQQFPSTFFVKIYFYLLDSFYLNLNFKFVSRLRFSCSIPFIVFLFLPPWSTSSSFDHIIDWNTLHLFLNKNYSQKFTRCDIKRKKENAIRLKRERK